MMLHPATRDLDLDDPLTTAKRREIIGKRKFLRQVYGEWYRRLVAALPPGEGSVVELGSGAGFLAEVVRGAITSEVLPVSRVRALMDGCALPFADGTLRAILMTNVLHHLPNVKSFLREADRSLRPGGVVATVEPWLTPWSRYVYTHWHHEPFDPEARSWDLPPAHPLSSANGALPWIVFERDRAVFEAEFPSLRVRSIEPLMPFSYLISGGFSALSIAPGWSFRFWRSVERAVRPLELGLAMFAVIVLERSSDAFGGRRWSPRARAGSGKGTA
jgi:SAM-dependent methyltransferase